MLWYILILWFVAVWGWALWANYRAICRERDAAKWQTRLGINEHYQSSRLPVEKWVQNPYA